MSRRALPVAILACLLLVGAVSAAQGNKKKAPPPYALIFGTVYGPNDVPVYGAVVQVQRADGKKVKGGELRSDHHGEFALRVPPGEADYVVQAQLKAEKKTLRARSKVHVNNDERVDVGLHLTE